MVKKLAASDSVFRISRGKPQWHTVQRWREVTSVSFNGLPVLHSTVDLESPESVVTFVVTSRAANASGVVRDDNQNALPGVIVVLLPEALPDSVQWFDQTSIHVTTADQKGVFRFTSLAPGRYRAIILNGAARDRSRDLAFLRDRESSPVELDFGQNATLDLRAR